MDRRNFLSASLTASALSVAGAATAGAQSPASSPNAAAEYYDLRRYQLVSGPGTRLTDNYFAGALIPALYRLGIGPVGAFSNLFLVRTRPLITFCCQSTKLETPVTADLELAKDPVFRNAAVPRGRVRYPPIRTVNSPNTITPPCAVMSIIRAAGKPQTRTVKDPNTITSGGPTHVNMSVTRACGSPPVSTVTAQGGRMGPPTCGTSTVNIGQTCMSVARAAGNMLSSISRLGLQRKPVVFRKRYGAQTATAACTECTSTLQSAARPHS
jgi:hypothetical protein